MGLELPLLPGCGSVDQRVVDAPDQSDRHAGRRSFDAATAPQGAKVTFVGLKDIRRMSRVH